LKICEFFPYNISSSELNGLCYEGRCLSDVYVVWHCRAVILTVYLFSPSVNYQPQNDTPM